MKGNLLLVILLCTSCGVLVPDFVKKDGPAPPIAKSTNPKFKDLITEFEGHWGKNVKTPINFNKLKKTAAGVCFTWSSGYTEIEIDTDKWGSFSDSQKKALVFHELGHCELKRDHRDTLNDYDGCAISLLHSYLVSDYCATTYMDEYIVELFK